MSSPSGLCWIRDPQTCLQKVLSGLRPRGERRPRSLFSPYLRQNPDSLPRHSRRLCLGTHLATFSPSQWSSHSGLLEQLSSASGPSHLLFSSFLSPCSNFSSFRSLLNATSSKRSTYPVNILLCHITEPHLPTLITVTSSAIILCLMTGLRPVSPSHPSSTKVRVKALPVLPLH